VQHSRLIALKSGDVALETPYDPALVSELKLKVPPANRKWDKDARHWLLSPQYAQVAADLVHKHFDEVIKVPQVVVPVTTHTTRTIRLEYLSLPKPRSDGSIISYGWADESWSLIFPLTVLQAWFCIEARPEAASTLYATLGVSNSVDPAALKSAYRRAARTWHPDVCKEIGAEEQFKLISRAYQVLGDPSLRAKYDAGLMLEQSIRRERSSRGPVEVSAWRPPLRCGWLMVEGTPGVGKFGVTRIVLWEDITDDAGRTLVTFWRYGDEKHSERWI
jgi:hypothetical protein